MRGVALLNPQAYGVRIQNRIIQDCGLAHTTGDGDLVDSFGDHVEIKTSLIRKEAPGNKMNLVQIRPWERCTYLFIAFDLRNDGFEIYPFKLSRGEMEKEIELLGAQSAHGTRKVTAENIYNEKAVRIAVESYDLVFNRWCDNYRSNYLIGA